MVMRMPVVMRMVMPVVVIVIVIVIVVMPRSWPWCMRQVDVKFHAGDGGFLPARNVQMIAVELELFQLALQPARIHAQIQQRGDEHVAGDAADQVEIQSLHVLQSNGRQPTPSFPARFAGLVIMLMADGQRPPG